jgi:hypothetical protein
MAFSDKPGLKKWSRDFIVGDECGSDEYRESQPEGLFNLLAEVCSFDNNMTTGEQQKQLVGLVAEWAAEAVRDWGSPMLDPEGSDVTGGYIWYGGADHAQPIYALIHDIMWDAGRSPRFDDESDLIESYNECEDESYNEAEQFDEIEINDPYTLAYWVEQD